MCVTKAFTTTFAVKIEDGEDRLLCSWCSSVVCVEHWWLKQKTLGSIAGLYTLLTFPQTKLLHNYSNRKKAKCTKACIYKVAYDWLLQNGEAPYSPHQLWTRANMTGFYCIDHIVSFRYVSLSFILALPGGFGLHGNHLSQGWAGQGQ